MESRRALKFILSLGITLTLIYFLDNRLTIGAVTTPPLGRFVDPFHGFWANLEADDARPPEELNIPGLKDKVTVVFDSLMIPHIFAANDEDLYLAQGYITAMHRLWQMEFQTHAAAGRVSEIIGKSEQIQNYDRGQRRLGMVYGAQKALEGMQSDSTTRMMINKYTEGINHYIESLTDASLPFEYKLLNYRPEPWTPLKCALLLKSMAQSLNMRDKDMEMSNALKLFGPEIVNLLYPDQEPVGDPIVDNPGNWKFNPVKLDTVPLSVPQQMIPAKPELIRTRRLPAADVNTGSNNWVVAGSKTTTGSPILCGDPHLGLNLPSLWYTIQLHAPGVNTMGVSLPGSPGVIIGFNDSIAWSVTNAQRDLVDWYQIQFENSSKERYMLDGKWVATEKVVEEFKIRDQPSFYDTIVYTKWGPVTYDEKYHAEDNKKHYAFRWIAHDRSIELLTFYKLNRARNHAEYMAALNSYSSPAQNFVFASVSGDIAMRVQGKFPVRRPNEGKFVLDGSKSSSGWHAFIPNDQNIAYKNPERAFISSANQYPVDATYPYYITAVSWEAYRNRRINKILSQPNKLAVADMMSLQNDNYNLKAEESLPVFLNYLIDTTAVQNFTAEEKAAIDILKAWDYYNNKDSEGASYYEAWWDNLMPLLWDELEKEGITLSKPSTFTTIRLLKEVPALSLFDIQSTPEKETAREVVRKAFALAVTDIEDWKKTHGTPAAEGQAASAATDAHWGAYKDSYMEHLTRIKAFRIPVETGGNHDIVNAHSQTHGPSWRMIVSLERTGVKTWASYPGGQSGNMGSVHYSDILKRWVKGEYIQLLFAPSPEKSAGQTYATTTLTSEEEL